MKPFITPKVNETGKKLLQFQLEGGEQDSDLCAMHSRSITAYSMPEGHTFNAAWEFQLHFGNDNLLVEFSSACTQVADWQEAGSLNIRMAYYGESIASIGSAHSATAISPFTVERLEKLVYEDDDVISECGLILNGSDGTAIIFAAGISPGSVSVAAPFATGQFNPQFSLAACSRKILYT
ncbi:hypothetical protein GH983_13980 [Agrobacterium sp. MA01]|uniref:hypothetical protein n=1 Tax=Agrobacterium sp. MA01 TaxID=2664893 RepID=UPI00129AB8E1|nr:hypothetical protein [Agrobacterium sp. MA01]QGG91516.1 hypothetical protein GH983_13980 [Agrobacterium sp. MA01]